MTNSTPVTWDSLNVILMAFNDRLTAIENKLKQFGVGPHVLVASDGSHALCGGPGACYACDGPTMLWPGRHYESWQRRRREGGDAHEQVLAYAEARQLHAKFIPDYDSEGGY